MDDHIQEFLSTEILDKFGTILIFYINIEHVFQLNFKNLQAEHFVEQLFHVLANVLHNLLAQLGSDIMDIFGNGIPCNDSPDLDLFCRFSSTL